MTSGSSGRGVRRFGAASVASARRTAPDAARRTEPSSIHCSVSRASIFSRSSAGSRGARGARRALTSRARRSASVFGGPGRRPAAAPRPELARPEPSPLRPRPPTGRPRLSLLRPRLSPLPPRLSPLPPRLSPLRPRLSPLRPRLSLLRPRASLLPLRLLPSAERERPSLLRRGPSPVPERELAPPRGPPGPPVPRGPRWPLESPSRRGGREDEPEDMANHATARPANWAENAKNAPPAISGRCVLRSKSGGVLLSQGISPQVPSALTGLTSVFGMGTGVTLSLWPPKSVVNEGSPQGLQSKHERVQTKPSAD